MKILFSNNETIDLNINNGPLGLVYQQIYKNLSKVPLDFRKWYNPYYLDKLTYPELVDQLAACAKHLSVAIDLDKCLAHDQQYLNLLHKIYETNYNGETEWLDLHEYIHICERFHRREMKFLLIDYREKAGLLERKFQSEWMTTATTKIRAGDAFVQWSELGKNPYEYWQTNEPNDITRMCQLIKPWLVLKPKINIALHDIDTMAGRRISEFEPWWQQYSEAWGQHWKIPALTTQDIFSFVVIGQVPDITGLKTKLDNNITPIKIQLV